MKLRLFLNIAFIEEILLHIFQKLFINLTPLKFSIIIKKIIEILTQEYLLGLSCFYHDSAAVLICNGEIISAVQEERLSIKKYDSRFPENAVKYCLKSYALTRFYYFY